jgi:hypothetical protein
MTTEMRVPEGTLCDHCKNPESPLTEENSQHISSWFGRDREGKEITHANVHPACAQAWAKANGGTIVNDEPLPPRPAL